ncbi:MAG: hypothetical protein ABSD64_09250 [Terriglobales bacterium]|jgi:hypothetical protein
MVSKTYRNKTCGYCGRDTGPSGEGEHVLPKCLYPDFTGPTIQHVKIPACPDCNNSWENDEAHFKTMLVLCGPDPTPARKQLWERSVRSFERPLHGEKEVRSITAQFVASPILNELGSPYQRIFPHKDPRVVRVLKKIVRGLEHFRTGDVIPEDRVEMHPSTFPLPAAYQDDLTEVFVVPSVFSAHAFFFSGTDASDMHSLWVLEFFESARFYAMIASVGRT